MSILTTQDDFFRQIKAEGQVDGIPTGYKEIDMRTGGFRKGRLYILGGRPAMGTTTLAIQMILNVLAKGKKVVVFSQEMSAELFARKIIAVLSERQDLIFDVDDIFEAAKEWLSFKELVIDDATGITASAIRNRSITESANLIVIDCLQLMSTESVETVGLGLGRLNDLIHEIKLVSEGNDVAILGTIHAGRACEMTEDKRPRLVDICESACTDADVVMGVYRDAYYDSSIHQDPVEIIFLQNRDGTRGVSRVEYGLTKYYFLRKVK